MVPEFIRCPGCGHLTHYQWVTHPSGEGRAYCPECKGNRRGLPAAAPELEGLIYRLVAPRACEAVERAEVISAARAAVMYQQLSLL